MAADIEGLMYMIDDRAMNFRNMSEKDIKPLMDEINESVGELSGGVSA